jgi:anaerobic magnesium-protoporphyrin IX monomethyl ester cyclase
VVAPKAWDEATDRDYLLRGRHSRAYYKQADRWLRNEVAAFRMESEDPPGAAAKRAEALAAREMMMAMAGEVEA